MNKADLEKQLQDLAKRLETLERQTQGIFKRLERIESQMKGLNPSGPEPAKQPPEKPRIAYNPKANYKDDPLLLEIAKREEKL